MVSQSDLLPIIMPTTGCGSDDIECPRVEVRMFEWRIVTIPVCAAPLKEHAENLLAEFIRLRDPT